MQSTYTECKSRLKQRAAESERYLQQNATRGRAVQIKQLSMFLIEMWPPSFLLHDGEKPSSSNSQHRVQPESGVQSAGSQSRLLEQAPAIEAKGRSPAPAAAQRDRPKPSYESGRETEKKSRKAKQGPSESQERKEINTIYEAYTHCLEIAMLQLQKAREMKAPINEPISGDSDVRKRIATILPDFKLRELFLALGRDHANWPRMRPLFGSPPYHFLLPEDAGLLRAGGFAAKRVNMSYSEPKPPNYNQLGNPHFKDDDLREYRVVVTRNSANESISIDKHLDGTVYLNVRLPKRSIPQKIKISKTDARNSIMFPRIGEVIRLQEAEGLAKALGRSGGVQKQQKSVRVVQLARAGKAATAVLAVKVL